MNKKNILLLAVIIFVGAAIFLSFLGFKTSSFRLIGSIPELNNEVPTGTGTIKLTFSKKLDSSVDYRQQIEGDNADMVANTKVEDENLLIILRPLAERKAYSFKINTVRSVDGDVINELPLSFTAIYIPFNRLSKEQQEFELSQTDRGNQENKLSAHLPFQGDGFYLTGEYTASEEGETIFVVNAQLLLTRDDLTNRSAAVQSYKQKVGDYIRSKNLNPDDYLIRYIITEPPARPS